MLLRSLRRHAATQFRHTLLQQIFSPHVSLVTFFALRLTPKIIRKIDALVTSVNLTHNQQ